MPGKPPNIIKKNFFFDKMINSDYDAQNNFQCFFQYIILFFFIN